MNPGIIIFSATVYLGTFLFWICLSLGWVGTVGPQEVYLDFWNPITGETGRIIPADQAFESGTYTLAHVDPLRDEPTRIEQYSNHSPTLILEIHPDGKTITKHRFSAQATIERSYVVRQDRLLSLSIIDLETGALKYRWENEYQGSSIVRQRIFQGVDLWGRIEYFYHGTGIPKLVRIYRIHETDEETLTAQLNKQNNEPVWTLTFHNDVVKPNTPNTVSKISDLTTFLPDLQFYSPNQVEQVGAFPWLQ